MPQPTQYNRQVSFTGLAAQNPDQPYTGVDLDAEFNAVKVTLDQLRANLEIIQRDDGDLRNGIVGAEQLEASLLTGLNAAEPWETGQDYQTIDTVVESNRLYVCAVAHTSGTFATDLAADYWSLLADFNTFEISDGEITTAKLAATAVTTAKITDAAVTYAKIQNVSATDKLLGRSSSGAGVVEEIACTAAGRALLDDTDAAAQRTTLGLGALAVLDDLAIDNLSDVSSGSPADGQVLTWIADNGQYEPATPAAGSGAPLDVDYLVRTAAGALTAERVVTDTSTVAWDWATSGQAKAAIVAASVDTAHLADDAVTTAKITDGAVTGDKLAPGLISGLDTGTMIATARIRLPSGFLWCNGAAVSRATYSDLFDVLTVEVTGNRTSGSTSIASVSEDLRNLGLVGAKIEGTDIPAGATITAVTATTITLSAAATSGSATSTTLTILPWGNGDGSTTFNVPDKRGRVGAGRDDMGAAGDAAASRLTSATVLGTKLGNAGGSQTHTLITAELAVHAHTATTSVEVAGSGAHTHSGTTGGAGAHSHGGFTGQDGNHKHTVKRYQNLTTITEGNGNNNADMWRGTTNEDTSTQEGHTHSITAEGNHTHSFSIGTSGTHSHTATADTTVNNAGSGSAHNNVQPTLIENWIIKT